MTAPYTDDELERLARSDLTADERDAARATGMDPRRYVLLKQARQGRRSVPVTEIAAALAEADR